MSNEVTSSSFEILDLAVRQFKLCNEKEMVAISQRKGWDLVTLTVWNERLSAVCLQHGWTYGQYCNVVNMRNE